LLNDLRVSATKCRQRELSCNTAVWTSVCHVSVRRGLCRESIRSSMCICTLCLFNSHQADSLPSPGITPRLPIYVQNQVQTLQHAVDARMPVDAAGMYMLAHPIGGFNPWHRIPKGPTGDRVNYLASSPRTSVSG
jgi:hypothetical protein